jgi:hypothetical protein
MLSLGKLPKLVDNRTFQLKGFIRKPKITIPDSYSFEKQFNCTLPLINQGDYNACTVFAAATTQSYFEFLDQQKLIAANSDFLLEQYRSIMKGNDGGAYMLDALKLWRNLGIRLSDRNYRITSFFETDITEIEIKQSLYTFHLGYAGILCTENFMRAVESGAQVVKNGSKQGECLGGHAITVCGYDEKHFYVTHTWDVPRRVQAIETGYFLRYCDEFYVCVDETMADTAKALKLKKMEAALAVLKTRLEANQ